MVTRLMVVVIGCAVCVQSAHAVIYGIKSKGSSADVGEIAASIPPARLFSFSENGLSFTSYGVVTRAGAAIDVDGLAANAAGDLWAFDLRHPGGTDATTLGSTLIRLNKTNAQAQAVGAELLGRDIRGALFDLSDRLWAVDAASNELLQINAATGAVVAGSARSLKLGGAPFDVSTFTDLAVATDRKLYLGDEADLYTIDLWTGVLTWAGSSTGDEIAGMAFSATGGPDQMFTFDVAGADDLLILDVSQPTLPRTVLIPNIYGDPNFNAGRGDLATVSFPEPSAGLLLAAAGLLVARRHRR